ncbi:helix-turn-helix, type 11 domain-containing protein [Caballeronia calidae]|uniref:Helix-turn-helix, type 11 domain-containing protein n=1 Tax=Caballeronia calidae TaxID=1777139 RepID=A0A158EIL7_9BURK|nr:helix-turn-helix, type 11 domain-containing protein [Caballeronia calidae]
MAQLIEREYGIKVSAWTVGRYLNAWGMSAQKPVRRAYERNDASIARWLNEDYPQIAKEAKREKATMYWGDEMGLRSSATCSRKSTFGMPHRQLRNYLMLSSVIAQLLEHLEAALDIRKRLVTGHDLLGGQILCIGHEQQLAPDSNLPMKHCHRWDRLTDRAKVARASVASKSLSVNYVNAQRHLAEGDDGSGKMV